MVSVKLKEWKQDDVNYRTRIHGWVLQATVFIATGGLNSAYYGLCNSITAAIVLCICT